MIDKVAVNMQPFVWFLIIFFCPLALSASEWETIIGDNEAEERITTDTPFLVNERVAENNILSNKTATGITDKIVEITLFGISIKLRQRMGETTHTAKEGPLTLHYSPVSPQTENSIPSDVNWPVNTTKSDLLNLPHYVADIIDAAYYVIDHATMIRTSDKGHLLNIWSLFDIYVINTGGDSGVTPLGGPVLLTNAGISGWQELRLLVAHELVHMLQKKQWKYGSYESENRWFLEATAQYLAGRLMCNSDEERKNNFSDHGTFLVKYLSIDITASDEGSHYAVGHFLYWLDQKYGATFIPDILTNRGYSADIENLKSAIRSKKNSFEDVFFEYVSSIVTNPGQMSGIGGDIKVSLYNNSVNHLKTATEKTTNTNFSRTHTFKKLDRKIAPRSVQYITFSGSKTLTSDGLLVVECKPTSWKMKSLLYGLSSDSLKTSSYSGLKLLDKNNSYPYSKPITIPFNTTGKKPVKMIEHVLLHDLVSPGSATTSYYLLVRPEITQVGKGTKGGILVWSTVGLATKTGIPADYILGYDVYTINGKKLNAKPILLPSTPGEEIVFENDAIDPEKTKASDYVVCIVDKYGNTWPVPPKKKKVVIDVSLVYTPNPPCSKDDKPFQILFTASATCNGKPCSEVLTYNWYRNTVSNNTPFSNGTKATISYEQKCGGSAASLLPTGIVCEVCDAFKNCGQGHASFGGSF